MQRYVLAAAVLIALAAGAFALRPRAEATTLDLVEVPPPSPTSPPTIVVDVAGAIARPGVVHLQGGARVLDALLAAGGMTPDADGAALNKAAPLRDGDRVYVPRRGEAGPPGGAGSIADDRIDLNRASARELEALPGVGPGIAGRIVRAREQRPFTRVEELQTRGLVSARVLEDLRDLVVVR